MTLNKNSGKLSLRPHHAFCIRFLDLDQLIRGQEFARAISKIKEFTQCHRDLTITIIEGPDQLCKSCPHCINNKCENPFGNEEAVRKWDWKILQELGITYEKDITARELLRLITDKAPLQFCKSRCPWKTICGVFRN